VSILKHERIQVPLKQRVARVVKLKDLSSTLRRVTLQGEDFQGFGFHPLAPEAHVKLFFPNASDDVLRMPEVLDDGNADWQGAAEGRFSAFRDYTIRSFDADLLTVDIDFVLHDVGVGGPWAKQAKVGDLLGIFGPRSVRLPPLDALKYVFFVDETSLPALARWLEILPESANIDARIEVHSVSSEISLPAHVGANLHWLHRNNEQENHPYGRLLLDALDNLPSGWACEKTWVWAATEAHAIVQLRRKLMNIDVLNKDHLDLVAYWKQF
jgi:NADPH-dependent ferric siderophore reductase